MRYPSIGLLMLAASATPLQAQVSRGAPQSPNPAPAGARTIPRTAAATVPPIKLEDQWTTALVRRDTRTFDRLLAPRGSDRVEWARNEGMRLHDFGDVQVITGVLHLRGKGKQGSFDRRYQFTDTWQRRNGHWQIIAAHDYLISK